MVAKTFNISSINFRRGRLNGQFLKYSVKWGRGYSQVESRNNFSNMDHHGSKNNNSITNFRVRRWNGQTIFLTVNGRGEGIQPGWIKTISHTQTIISVSLYKMLTNTFNNFRKGGLNDQKMFQNIQWYEGGG